MPLLPPQHKDAGKPDRVNDLPRDVFLFELARLANNCPLTHAPYCGALLARAARELTKD